MDYDLIGSLDKKIKTGPGCWEYLAGTQLGYGRVWTGTHTRKAHAVVYELLVGPVPEGKQLDHICHDPSVCPGGPTCPHRRCVNPDHLVPKTPWENQLNSNSPTARNSRRDTCKNGHEFTHLCKDGWRRCRQCKTEAMRGYRAAKKQK